ncbi:RebB family R body protein [Chryseobacterium wanjuense]
MEIPAYPTVLLYQNAAHSAGLMYQNSVSNQNNLNILGQAATTQGIMQIYSINTFADTTYIDKILNFGNARVTSNRPENNQSEGDEKDKK